MKGSFSHRGGHKKSTAPLEKIPPPYNFPRKLPKSRMRGEKIQMGRSAKPVELLMLEGRKHLTKEEIEDRKNSEIKFGDKKIKCPDYVRKDETAYKKWKEINKLFRDFDFVSAGDSELIGRYCATYSEYLDLKNSYQRIKEIHYDSAALDKALDAELENGDGAPEKVFPYKVKKQLRDMISINALLAVENAINKKAEMLAKMEDRMFLNPISKLKNIPKKPKEEEPSAKWGKYGGMSG